MILIGLVRKLDLREHIGFNILNHLYINASDNDILKEIMYFKGIIGFN